MLQVKVALVDDVICNTQLLVVDNGADGVGDWLLQVRVDPLLIAGDC
jgi:hypothetical protein